MTTMSVLPLVLFVSLFGFALSRLHNGYGLCDGGLCGQCSPVVYHTEQSVLVSFQKLTSQLLAIQNTLIAELNSIHVPWQRINVSIGTAYTAIHNKIKVVNSFLFNRINDLVLLANNLHRGDDQKVHAVLLVIQQIQSSVKGMSTNLIALTNEVIYQYGKTHSGSTVIHEVTASIVKIQQMIVKISQDVLVVVRKVDAVFKSANSVSIAVNNMKFSVVKIKKSIQSFIAMQQTLIASLKRFVYQQRKDLNDINVKVKDISMKSTKLFESLKISHSYSVAYQNDLTQINANVKRMNGLVVDSQTTFKRLSARLSSIVNRMRLLSAVVKKSMDTSNGVYVQINNVYNNEIALLQKIAAFEQQMGVKVGQLSAMIRDTETMIGSILSKVSIIKTNSEKNARSVISLMGTIRSDISKLGLSIDVNGRTASKLTQDVTTLEARMAVVMKYLAQLEEGCKAQTPKPVSKCEVPRFNGCPDNPLCANDGKEYRSTCEMAKVACLTNTILTVVNMGPCVRPTTTPAPPNCGFTCDPVIKPVCANNGKTYSCYCIMKLMACVHRLNLYVVSQGACEIVAPTASSCNFFCSGGQTICGSDGVTYASMCKMLEAVCWSKTQITKKHDGRCGGVCPVGFLRIGSGCFYFATPQKGKSRRDAVADCKMRGSNIAFFTSDVQWKAVQQHLFKEGNGRVIDVKYWTGAQLSATGKWSWYHSKTVHFGLKYAWKSHIVPSRFGQEGCGVLNGLDIYELVLHSCTATGNERYGWICAK